MEGIEGLNFDSILNDDQVESLFSEFNTTDEEDADEVNEKFDEDDSNDDENDDLESKSTKKNNKKTTEVDPEEMFTGEPESVGSEFEDTEEEDTDSTEQGTSPDFFSSIANAFVEEGIFPDLQEEEVKNIKTAQDFRDAVEKQIQAGLTEQQQRVINALNNGVEPEAIKVFENTIAGLENLDDETLEEEGERGEALRKQLLYQDYLNRGFSKQRAEKAVNKAFEDGTDIEDAKDALEGLKEFYTSKYNQELQLAELKSEENKKNQEKRRETFKNKVLKDNFELFNGVSLNKNKRQEAFDAVTKPIYKDPETGNYLTAIGKYSMEHPEEYMAKLGLLFVLTNGFENLDDLVGRKAKKAIKKGFADLENKINNSYRDSRGNLKFTSGSKDSASFFGKGMILDV